MSFYDYAGIRDFLSGLTGKEMLLVHLRMRGYTERQCANVFGCTEPNISYHLGKIKRKFEENWIN